MISDSPKVTIRPHLLPLMILLTVLFVTFSESLQHEFLTTWDDTSYVVANETVAGFSVSHIKQAVTRFYVGNYAPLQIISYMVDYSLWGMKPAGFIFTNIALHFFNGVLFYLLLFLLTRQRLWAFSAAFIFLFHPVQIESVVWISQRKTVLAMFFFLWSFHFYLMYQQNALPKPDNKKYLLSLLCFIAALLSKSVAVILPLILVLYDYCLKKKGWPESIRNKFPFIVVALSFSIVTWVSHSPELGGGGRSYYGGSLYTTILTMLPVVIRYLKLVYWPTELSAIYAPEIKTSLDSEVLNALCLELILISIMYFLFRKRREMFFWGCVFVAGLLPVSQLVPIITLMNDRYLYFPMLGCAAFSIGSVLGVQEKYFAGQRKWLVLFPGLVLVLLPVLSFQRAKVWQSSVTLWSDTLGKVPNNPQVLFSLATAYHQLGQLDKAVTYYLKSLELSPGHLYTLNNLCNLYLEKNDPELVKPYADSLIRLYPDRANGYVILGSYYRQTGNLSAAAQAFSTALQLDPGALPVYRKLAMTLIALHDYAGSRQVLHKALSKSGETALLDIDFACLEAAEGNLGGAVTWLEKAFANGFRDVEQLEAIPELRQVVKVADLRRFLQNTGSQH